MAAVLPTSHTYNGPAAGGNARQLNGDVRGQVHLGDKIYYGRLDTNAHVYFHTNMCTDSLLQITIGFSQ